MAGTVPGVLLTGNHAGRPSSGVSVGTLYSCTTHGLIYQTTDTGSTWGTWATLGASPSGSITASGYTQNTARILGRTTASSGAIEEITVGSGLSLAAGSLTATGGGTQGTELDYVQFTGAVSVTATTEGTANTVVSGTSQSYAADPMIVHFYAPRVVAATGISAAIFCILVEDTTVLGHIYLHRTPSADGANFETANGFRRLTPTAGTHQYHIKAWRTVGNGSIEGGAGGSGADLPGFIRITKV